jgi:hypothetical protein
MGMRPAAIAASRRIREVSIAVADTEAAGMSRKQGPHCMGMRPAAIAASRRIRAVSIPVADNEAAA